MPNGSAPVCTGEAVADEVDRLAFADEAERLAFADEAERLAFADRPRLHGGSCTAPPRPALHVGSEHPACTGEAV
ncbi:hypothetical protein [Curtanaerobium respiraculi]|uniref:hypothetical protein n=1 Tax=Curtanaerobium respiraculi TaxID=2949669 RepID=UPI0024B38FAD|nr:hypothetical protein [Curtanaerobium respiraculi]